VATRVWSLQQGQEVLDFNGPYSEFVEKHAAAATQRR